MLILIEVYLHYFHTNATRQAQSTNTHKNKTRTQTRGPKVSINFEFNFDFVCFQSVALNWQYSINWFSKSWAQSFYSVVQWASMRVFCCHCCLWLYKFGQEIYGSLWPTTVHWQERGFSCPFAWPHFSPFHRYVEYRRLAIGQVSMSSYFSRALLSPWSGCYWL